MSNVNAAAYPRLTAAIANMSIQFNGIRYKQQNEYGNWVLLGFEGEEDSIERQLDDDK